MELWEIAARLQIRDTTGRNFFLYDHDRFEEAYTSTFTPDGVLEPAPGQQVRRGVPAILERFALRDDGRLGPYGYVRHHLTTQHIESITPEHADVWTYYVVYLDGALATGGVLHDDFVAVGGEWMIKRRQVLQDFSNVEPPKHL